MKTISLLFLLWGCALTSFAQFSLSQLVGATGLPKAASDQVKSVSDKSLAFLQKKYNKLDASIEKQSQKMLARLDRIRIIKT